MGNSETVERFKSRSSEVPLWHRQNLSVQETCAYTGLGRETIYSLIKQKDCNFALRVGRRTILIVGIMVAIRRRFAVRFGIFSTFD